MGLLIIEQDSSECDLTTSSLTCNDKNKAKQEIFTLFTLAAHRQRSRVRMFAIHLGLTQEAPFPLCHLAKCLQFAGYIFHLTAKQMEPVKNNFQNHVSMCSSEMTYVIILVTFIPQRKQLSSSAYI